MPVGFSTAVRVINPPPSPRNSPRSSVTPRTRQSGRDSRSSKTHSRGRKRKTKVKKANKSKRGSQKKRGRKASKRQRGGVECTPAEDRIQRLQYLLNPDENVGVGNELVASIIKKLQDPRVSIIYKDEIENRIKSLAKKAGLKFCDDNEGKGKNSKGETLRQYIDRIHNFSDNEMKKADIFDKTTLLKACLAFVVASRNGFPTFWTNQ